MNIMREELSKMENKRAKFKGVFVRYGQKDFKGHITKTILLKYIMCGREPVSDHLWFNQTKEFEGLNLQEGDKVEFYARVRPYYKGYIDKWLDFKLSNPTQLRKLIFEEKQKVIE